MDAVGRRNKMADKQIPVDRPAEQIYKSFTKSYWIEVWDGLCNNYAIMHFVQLCYLVIGWTPTVLDHHRSD